MKYVLKWSGRENSEVNQLAFEYCKQQIPICKDVCEFINHDRYLQLIAAEEIEGPTKYSGINQFEIGMIAFSSYANEYRQSWENLDLCYKDFIAGYEACNKKLKFQLDWDEAIKLNIKHDDDSKIRTRRITMDLSTFADENSYLAHEVFSCLIIDFPEIVHFTRKSNRHKTILVLSTKTTAVHANYIANSIELYYKARKVA
jgi:hypothetical protein